MANTQRYAPLPPNEDIRLQVLHSYGILDTAPEKAFDGLTAIAARTADVPISLISLVDRDRQYFKSCFGTSLRETPREQSFCAHAIMVPDKPLIIEDARKDERTRNNILVTGAPYIRFYAGFPISDRRTQLPLGTLCVIGTERKSLSEEQIESLKSLASMVEDELELRAKKKELQESEKNLRQLYDASQQAIENLRANLLHTVSHELRTPLNAVVGMTNLLKSDWENMDKEEIVEILEHVNEGGMSLTKVVERITLYAELEIQDAYGENAFDNVFRKGKCRVKSALDNAIEALADVRLYTDRLSDLSIQVENALLPVPEALLSSAIWELLDNAMKFSGPGNPIEIRGTGTTEKYKLSITDHGHGLTEAQKRQIGALMQFNRKEQEQQGWGLGLALVLQLGRVYNFAASFESVPGKGTTAVLRFPYIFSDIVD